MSGTAELLVVGVSGEVRGYVPAKPDSAVSQSIIGGRGQQVRRHVCG